MKFTSIRIVLAAVVIVGLLGGVALVSADANGLSGADNASSADQISDWMAGHMVEHDPGEHHDEHTPGEHHSNNDKHHADNGHC